MITHYDLFAGIGGFSIALEEVFKDEPIKHIFCEWEPFPTAVLKRHWPDGEFWGDIAELVAHTASKGFQRELHRHGQDAGGGGKAPFPRRSNERNATFTIVTGGFPCQPFSHAGRRRGTADDRYQWPNMFAVIRNVKPDWVIAENVRGLVTWNDGMVLEQVCSDMESEGYEVQPFIIPAVAVNAPHRRDRVWVIAHRGYAGLSGRDKAQEGQQPSGGRFPRGEPTPQGGDAPNTSRERRKPGRSLSRSQDSEVRNQGQCQDERSGIPDWKRDWQEVAFATCDDSMDDGLPRLVDGVPVSGARWRKESLKAYGNGIVPQVAMQIMEGIKLAEKGNE